MEDSVELIHQDLAAEAESGISSLYESWKSQGSIDPFLLVWPSTTIEFNGQRVNDMVPYQLPSREGEQYDFIAQVARRTSAWALMTCVQRDQAVVVVFESPVGTKSWRLPIQRIGATDSLGDPTVRENVDYIGVQWRP